MRHNQGFTLLEVLVALIILTVGIVSIVGIFSKGIVGSVDAENTAIAMNLAQRRMEEYRNLDFDTGVVNEAKAAVSGFPGFQREVVVAEPQTALKQVTVKAYWSYKGGEVTVPLVTYISKN